MKFFWVDCTSGSWNKRKSLITAALESGAKGVLVLPEDVEKTRKLGNIDIVSEEGEIVLVRNIKKIKGGKSCGYVEIRSKEDERFAAEMAKKSDFIIVVGRDWKVIPMENLIAELQKEKVRVMAGVKDSKEARLAFETLEVGVDGVLLQNGNINEIKRIGELVMSVSKKIPLKTAKVTKLRQVGMGDRVCVDTASLLSIGEGMLLGSQSNGLFLVHSETLESEYVASRPFRVNAGAVHAYILTPRNKTKYLSEINAGDEVLVTDSGGNARSVVVGRVKIEKRPMMLLEARCGRKTYKTLLQNAETINLVDKDGNPVSIAKLKKGDEIQVYVKETGRHFGMEVEESVIER